MNNNDSSSQKYCFYGIVYRNLIVGVFFFSFSLPPSLYILRVELTIVHIKIDLQNLKLLQFMVC